MAFRKLAFAVALWATAVALGVAWGQEFPEDELVAEQVVVVPFRTGKINRGKIRQIYKHTIVRSITVPVRRFETVTRQSSHLYTYLPHPVKPVERRVAKTVWETVQEYRALPTVGVTPQTTGSKSSARKRR
ncbi:MAG: hypothetical protein ACK40X_10030 [Armatimonadota bacterium]